MEEFIEKLATLFPSTACDEITADIEFKYLDDWSSMASLQLIALVEDEYDVTLSSDEIRNADTIEELYMFILKKN